MPIPDFFFNIKAEIEPIGGSAWVIRMLAYFLYFFDSGSQHKAIALLVEDQNSHTIWESLGFKKAQILKVSELSGMRDRLNALASGAGADVIANDVLIDGLKYIRGGMNETRE